MLHLLRFYVSELASKARLLPPWAAPAAIGAGILTLVGIGLISSPPRYRDISVAFVGNSMQYYNDLPRFMEELSDHHVTQNSCLHGGATLVSLLYTGNGMYNKWQTTNAMVEGMESQGIYDFGACSVSQLLYGYDERFYNFQDGDDEFNDDDYEAAADDDMYAAEFNDGKNPCYEDANYLPFLEEKFETDPPDFDFVVLNDETMSPARYSSRQESLAILEDVYIQYFNVTGAAPVFVATHAYWVDWRDMSGLEDIPTFTSLTYEGYRQYAAVLEENLPREQRPRLAPVGVAFLTVWEENYSMWEKLFHEDGVHASPLGTFLTGCVLHYTLFGRMPKGAVALREDMSALWMKARRMQPPSHQANPMPTRQEAGYLFRVVERVVRYGHRPKSFIAYANGEAAPDVDDEE